MINKVLREKSNSVVCRSSKSSKTKIQKKNNFSDNIIVQIVFTSHKNIQIYYKNCKKHTGNTFPKKLVLISKNKVKGKSKCAICFTERTFIHEIEHKCGLESELEKCLQFFTD